MHSSTAQVSIVEIPTLGGSDGEAQAMNEAGALAGFAFRADGQQHAFLFSGGNVFDLGTLGGRLSHAWDLNASSHVVGQSTTAGDFEQHAFLFRDGQMLDLGTLGGPSSMAVALSDTGYAAGTSYNAARQWRAFRWNNGQMQDLGTLGGNYSAAIDVNDLGQVVGQSYIGNNAAMRAFLHSGGLMQDLGTLGGLESFATAINASGMVIGDADTANGESHAFLYQDGQMEDLGTLGGSYSIAGALNDAGQVIGVAAVTGDAESRGFLYHDGVMTDIGSLGSGISHAWGLNGRGQVVGFTFDADWRMLGFVWDNGVMRDLNTLLPPDSGWELMAGRFINDAGQIAGFGIFDGRFTQFLLTPQNANRPPVADAGSDLTAECSGAVVLDGSASVDPDGDALTHEWSEGGVVLGTGVRLNVNFPLGLHHVRLLVTDSHGARAHDDLIVTVVDSTAPVVTCPISLTVSADANCQAIVPDLRARVVATDNCTPSGELVRSQTPEPGATVSAGLHTVTVTVTDGAGNSTVCETALVVADTTPPVILSLAVTPNVLHPANRALVPVEVSVGTLDNCDSAPVCRIVSIESNEPETGAGDNTTGDFQVTGPLSAELRAERLSKGDGRVYSLTIECRDAAGNVSSGVVQVSVPKGKDEPGPVNGQGKGSSARGL